MDDTISRRAAIEAIRNLYPDMPKIKFMDNVSNWQKKNEKYIECENAIFALPSVQRKTGKWLEKKVIPMYENGIELQSCRCSECKRYDTRPYMYFFSEPHFCSWCGAKMQNDDKSHPFADDVMMKGESDE